MRAFTSHRLLLILTLALFLTLASFFIQRRGPEMGSYGNVCGPDGDQPCEIALLNGGFPLGYVFDIPSTSVRNQLMPWIEDEFRVVPFILDFIFFAIMVSIMFLGYQRLRKREESS